MHDLGVDAYRFSIAWSRVLPKGRFGEVNSEGIEFYNNIIDVLLVRGYLSGAYLPSRFSYPFGNCSHGDSALEPYIVTHNLVLSRATAAETYRKFVDPLVYGDYPPEMRQVLGSRLPTFSAEERKKLLELKLDFIGVNYYTTLYVKDCMFSSCTSPYSLGDASVYLTGEKDGVYIGEQTAASAFFIVPRGMEGIVTYVKERYNNTPMFITENGYAQPASAVNDSLNDTKRIEYHEKYLAVLSDVVRYI
ncbi:hypothetical protein NL676_021516 [Syzygium grande]|nr:hypothetical protein NL676_021516 [Syzygium grande]